MPGDAIIEVVAGPGSGRRLDLEVGSSAAIGRDPSCGLVIPDDTISRQHVKLENRRDGLLVTSIGKNPAVLDRRKLPKDGVLVRLKAKLELGAAKLEITFEVTPTPPAGLTLGPRIGRGATGSVYSGKLKGVKEPVAVKVVAPGADRQLLARAKREAELLERLDHPGIVRLHALLERDGRLYLVQELVTGALLEDRLMQGALGWAEAISLGASVAAALAHAHERGVVHRDISPANIFIGPEAGAVKLTDFGFAREEGRRGTIDGTFVTKTNDSLGTFCYIAPEQVGGAKDAGPAADVYGLAAVLYHALSGVRPFSDVPLDDFIHAIHRGATPLATVAPSVPQPLARAVMKAMCPVQEERPTAAAFGATLEGIVKR